MISRLGRIPQHFKPVNFASRAPQKTFEYKRASKKKEIVGVDVFLDSTLTTDEIAKRLQAIGGDGLQLAMIANRGVGVWPEGLPETFLSDHWRCRYLAGAKKIITHTEIVALLEGITRIGLDFIKIENLCTFDGEIAYLLAQGE